MIEPNAPPPGYRLFTRAAWIMLAGAALLALGIWLDPVQILGVSRWLKPLKFFASVAIFLFTTAYALRQLKPSAPTRGIAIAIVACLTIENLLITMQSARGVTSHFNNSTLFDGAVFGVMGITIVANTIAVAWLLAHLFRNALPLDPAILWGWRFGVILAILGSAQGFVMVARAAHTMGAADGTGPALPLLNWSMQFGDLRIAHFIGIHGFQVLPLTGYLLARTQTPRAPWLVALVFAACLGLAGLLLLQALSGKPLFF